MPVYMGIDIGTSGCKAILVDEGGKVLKQAHAEYPYQTPKPAWSEQRPEDWIMGVEKCLAELGERRPAAIGLTGQMHGAVFLNKQDRPIRPAILWNDQRTTSEILEINEVVGSDVVLEVTKNPPLTGFQAPKILWLRNNEPHEYAQVSKVLLPKDYVRLWLSGEYATDVSDASGTGVFDVGARTWAKGMLKALGLSEDFFPPAYESWQVTSQTRAGLAGLEPGIPIVAGGGDQAAGAVGCGAVAPGVLSASLGTSGVVFSSLDEPTYDPGGATHTFCHANGRWHAMGVILSCGGAVKWFRDTLAGARSYAEFDAAAEQSAPGANGVTFLPYLAGERTPHNNPYARGALVGMTLSNDFEDVARSILEGVSFAMADGLEALNRLGAAGKAVRVTGGGAKSPLWLKILSDALECDCSTLEVDEGPAFGAALLAAVGDGAFKNVQATANVVREKAKISYPGNSPYSEALERYRRLYRSLKPVFTEST